MAKIENFALIIGAMKCGTTSLYNYLAQHPEIASCHIKEVDFFNNQSRYDKGFDFYQNLWKWNADVHKYALEATPGYTRVSHPDYLNSAENIYQTQQDNNVRFKFIYILRDPIDRLESHYTQGRKFLHQDSLESLSEGITEEIIDTSRYAMQIDEYYQRFPSKDILLVNFEDLKANPDLLLKQICEFLAIDSDFQFAGLDRAHNSYNKELSRVVIPGYSWLRKTPFVKDFIDFLPNGIKQSLQIVRNLFAKKIEYEYVKLSPEQKSFVAEALKPDLQKLRDKYKVDISSWNVKA